MSEKLFEAAARKPHERVPSDLLLTPEEEEEESRKRGEPPYILRLEKEGDTLTAYGTKHVFSLEAIEDMRSRFESSHADILLVEGQMHAIPEDITDEAVIQQYGEQFFMAWNAKKSGKEVASWDVSNSERLRSVTKHHPPEAIVGWMIGQCVKHLLDQKRSPTTDAVKDMCKLVLTPEVIATVKLENGTDLDLENLDLDQIAQQYTGKTIAALTYQDGEFLATPRRRGPTNDVIREMNNLRDRHALNVIDDMRRHGKKNIFILAGGSHVLTWERALERMYQ